MLTLNDTSLYLSDFKDIWFTNCDDRYRVLKGGRATGKTYDFCGLEVIFKILSDPRRNILMIRQNDKDNAQSNFTIIKFLCNKLGVAHLFKFTTSPHKITRKDTGQVILFAGMNDVENITGTQPEVGYLTDIYFEEAFQLRSYEDFRVVDGSFRIPNYETDLKIQITFCLNAWDVGHWIYDIFFKDNLEDNVNILENDRFQFARYPEFTLGADGKGLALHISSTYCNPYNSKERFDGAEELKRIAYEIYKVEVLGCWGHSTDATYPYWNDNLVIPHYQATAYDYVTYMIGIDIGGSNGENKIAKNTEDNPNNVRSAMTMQLTGLTSDFSKLVSINEFFWTNENKQVKKGGPEIADDMIDTISHWCYLYSSHPTLMKGTIICYVESADPGDFQGLLRAKAKEKGLMNIKFINSTKNRIQARVDFDNLMMAYGEHLFTDKVPNLVREYKASKVAKDGRCREDTNDHAINAGEYSWIPILPRIKRYKDFKEH